MPKGSSGKSGGLGSSGKSTLGSTGNKTSNLGSSATKTSNFGSSMSKTSNFSATPSKSSTFGSTASKSSTYGALTPKDSSSTRGPSFLVAGGKSSSGLTPSTSKKTYEAGSYNPKNSKSSSFGIIWLPGKKRNKKKEMAYSSINYDKIKDSRTPTMYNVMSGDSPDYQLQKKKDEETNLLVPEKVKGPIATAASAGAVTIISEAPSDIPTDLEEKLLSQDKKDSKEAAGDSDVKENNDTDYLENKDVLDMSPDSKHKSFDNVDSVLIGPRSVVKPPQSDTTNTGEDDCVVKCLYYTLQCCDCAIM